MANIDLRWRATTADGKKKKPPLVGGYFHLI
jgi:hypothetical protein